MTHKVDFSEILISPLAKIIREVSLSVADAQQQLDATALASQTALEQTHPELFAAGYTAPWYQIPEAEVELKVAVHFERQAGQGPSRLWMAPFNAKYRTSMNFTADGASSIKFRIVPVPPVQPEPQK